MIRAGASPARPGPGRGEPALEDLAQGALLDAGHAADLLERLVAAERVGDVADRRHHGVDEADPAGRGLEVEAAGVVADEVLDERLGGADRAVQVVRRLADDLVGVLAVGQPRDADVLELDPRVVVWSWPMSPASAVTPSVPGLLAGRIDVVGEHDPVRVAGQQRDLARRQRGPERGDDVVEAGLVRHQRVGVALDDDGLAGPRIGPLARSIR